MSPGITEASECVSRAADGERKTDQCIDALGLAAQVEVVGADEQRTQLHGHAESLSAAQDGRIGHGHVEQRHGAEIGAYGEFAQGFGLGSVARIERAETKALVDAPVLAAEAEGGRQRGGVREVFAGGRQSQQVQVDGLVAADDAEEAHHVAGVIAVEGEVISVGIGVLGTALRPADEAQVGNRGREGHPVIHLIGHAGIECRTPSRNAHVAPLEPDGLDVPLVVGDQFKALERTQERSMVVMPT